MDKKSNRAILILFLISLNVFLCSTIVFADKNTTNIIDKFEYVFDDSSSLTEEIPDYIQGATINWTSFKDITSLSNESKNYSSIWFRTKLPEISKKNHGIYFEELFANSLNIYIDKEKIYEKKRIIYQDYNSILISLDNSYSNKYIYINILFKSSKIGPSENVFIGDYPTLQYYYLTKGLLNIYMGFGFIFVSIAVLLCSIILKNNDKKIGISLTIILTSLGIILSFFRTNILMFYSEYEPMLLILYDLALFLFFPCLTYFFELVIISNKNTFMHKFIKFQFKYSAFCIILIFINNIAHYKFNKIYTLMTIPVIGLLFIVQLIMLIYFGIKYSKNGSINAKIFLFGFISFAIILITELIIYLFIYKDYKFSMWKWGLIIFSISLIIIFGKKYLESHEKLSKYSEDLKTMSTMAKTDFLTKIPNRMNIETRLEIATENYRLKNTKFFIVLCDIDDFKHVNDSYGHNFGDQVLIEFVQIIQSHLNNLGVVGRWGGEEFLIILSDIDYDAACNQIEIIRKAINSHLFYFKKNPVHISASFGLCEYSDTDGLNNCIEYMDKSLYHAKYCGKNKLITYREFIKTQKKEE